MHKIKIGFVVNNLTVGGVSQVLISLCNSLDPNRFDIHLIVLSEDCEMEKIIPLKQHIVKHKINFHFNNSYSLITYLQTAILGSNLAKRAAKVIKLIDTLSLDILHFHTLPRQLPIGHIAQKKNPEIKLIFTDHLVRISKEDYNFYQKTVLAYCYRKFYKHFHLITVSKAVLHYIKTYKISDNDKKLLLLENTIQLEEYISTNRKNSTLKNFIYVSRLNHHKGQETLIKAWQTITSPNKGKLFLVGPDESDGKFKLLAKNDASIVFTGSVENVKDYLIKADVAVFPSEKEGLPIALLEKMAMELPIIVSDIKELTSIVKNEVEGLHFELNNTESLKRKIEYALKHPEKLQTWGINARRKVEDLCKKNDPVKFHEKLYNSVLNQ